MKAIMRSIVLLVVVLGLQAESNAQGVKMPQASSGQTIIQDFGLGKITLTYSRPNMKGRKIFGALEPFGKVWRTGANSATVIKFSDDVTIEGKDIPAGEYGLFTIPDKTSWTVILSKTSKTWGAYTYNAADDFARFTVKPMTMKESMETFTIQFANVKPTTAQLHLMWENTAVAINLSTSVDEKVMAGIDAAMKGDKKPYFQAAQYYFENGKDLKTALNWMNEAEKADPKAPWVKLWKGRVQLKMGDKAGAQATAQSGIDIATEIKNDEYIRLNTQLLAEAKK
ncbi:Protein of unknown function [Pedobacter insulae]|uniref:DUF2911 domain-containing protein n=2 Tax=Pedobacter insulae TaxID=414048 RepID=A0A1I2YT41_9SPHI|nr:Protein of unknown function [Pedobacter insulae]